MFALKKVLHDLAIALSRLLAKLLPDRIPVTFVGPHSSAELCSALSGLGLRRVLVVTDAALVSLGLVGRITDALAAAGVTSVVYDGVEPDPTFAQARQGHARLEAEGCDGVLAVGGGSPMDAAKVIAAMATNGGRAEALEGRLRLRKRPLPFFAIPTTAGTGSEVTIAAVLSDDEDHTKKFFLDPRLLPEMTALDPELMTGLPEAVTAATGMDALTHAVESFLAKTATPQTEAWSLCAVRLIFENLPRACREGKDLEARRAMALASYYAGLAFTRTSVGYVHAIAHTFGAYYGTPHGRANAIALPHVLDFSKPSVPARLARLAEASGAEGASERERAEAFIQAVRGLMQQIGIPATLDELKAEDIGPIARQALAEAYLNYPVPRYMSQADCEGLLGAIRGE